MKNILNAFRELLYRTTYLLSLDMAYRNQYDVFTFSEVISQCFHKIDGPLLQYWKYTKPDANIENHFR